jgi:hypothetical protein
MGRLLLCVAHGNDEGWEAICLDLDIAVQGYSLDEVKWHLQSAVRTYIQDALAESEPTRQRLLNRRAPFLTRLNFVLRVAMHALFRPRDGGGSMEASFEVPCHA